MMRRPSRPSSPSRRPTATRRRRTRRGAGQAWWTAVLRRTEEAHEVVVRLAQAARADGERQIVHDLAQLLLCHRVGPPRKFAIEGERVRCLLVEAAEDGLRVERFAEGLAKTQRRGQVEEAHVVAVLRLEDRVVQASGGLERNL